jgi:hypothetical protein
MQVPRREGEGTVAYFARNIAMAASAACWAEVMTLPIDTAKVRL